MNAKELQNIDIDLIVANKSQPRTYFDSESIEELARIYSRKRINSTYYCSPD